VHTATTIDTDGAMTDMGSDRGTVTVDEVVTMTTVSQIALSPDGKTVAYVLSTVSKEGEHPKGQIHLVAAEGPSAGQSRPFTSGGGMDGEPRWAPDGASLAFTSDRDKAGVKQLYVIALSGGEARRLTDERGGVADPRWAPDGARLAYLVIDGESEELERRKRDRDDAYVASEAIKRQRLWLIGADGAGARPLTPEGRHVWTHAWSPDGTALAVIASDTPEWNEMFGAVRLVVYAANGGETEPRDLGAAPFAEGLTWSRDGATIYALGSAAEDFPQTYLRAWPLSGGAPRDLLGDLPATPFLLNRPRDSDDLLLAAWRDSHTPVYRVSPDGVRVDLLPLGVESVGSVAKTDVSVSADGRRVAMVRSDGGHPDDLWVWDADAGPRQLTDVNPWLRDKRLGRQQEIEWASFDDQTIKGLLITPPGYEEGRRYPLVVNVHGGPTWLWTDHLHLNWHDWGMWLALQGYIVLLPNPRGSAGRGNRFARANVGDIGGGDYRDVMAGVDTLIDRGMVDADRMGIGGWSYGGTLTPWTLTQTDRFRCAVMGAGICNWVSFAGTCDIRVFGDRLFEAEQITDATALWKRSALSRVANVRTPTLIVHGEQDHRVPVSQGREFYSALRHLGVPTEYVTYPREGHQVGERHHQRDLLARLCDWYKTYLE